MLSLMTLSFISCDNEINNDNIGFMTTATITGDSNSGYHCYLDIGGLVISHNQELEGVERGYFSVWVNKEDWNVASKNDPWYIENAYVSPYTTDGIYKVIHPIQIDEAETKYNTYKGDNSIPNLFLLSQICGGYLDLSGGFSLVNLQNVEYLPALLDIGYNPAEQTPDSLKLQLYYHQPNPDEWTSTCFHYNTISCDISSLSTLAQWNDSVTIAVKAGDKKYYYRKISKNDFLKPNTKLE